MAENYQSQDLWSRTTTRNGYAADELRSVLQKSIRRGMVEEAILAGCELFFDSTETEEMLWRRLEIITTEDVGMGFPDGPAVIEALYQQAKRMADPGDRWMYGAHAIRILATARKDRLSMELACWARESLARGERRIEIEDYHLDMHTRRGVERGNGPEHWWRNGARLDNQINEVPSRYNAYLRRLYLGDGDGEGS
ncbi:hypothetical protein [Komagataeibacter oboediens]|nr:hypothetical protein [Komagataeibacter oboediens]GBR31832.1 hypothetical protein AA11826_0850 [Komagataeibacter oboediens DSM 11826]MBL7234106.1 AAA family ATPase [Komagataeibacter oboediens]MBV0888570.1 AAA family ATPase [Komagataeibacter oboediens]MCK9821071.1 AAA family ATPase [Komagataeibacter oboediens]PYD81946.1 AAA family ATPase [Komagataeibacter oboediens]